MRRMDYGICLPNYRPGASREAMDAAAGVAVRLGWSTAWTTDHVLVEQDSADEYGRVYEAILSLAWVGARHPAIRLGTSVIVVPVRDAVLVAKELATLDALSAGRVVAGVGVGWNEAEFGNLGHGERFRVRGAYLEEAIRLWRHLWSGSPDPFEGRFTTLRDFVFEPLPEQRARLPILVGGRAERALARVGRLADGYHSSATGPDQYARRVPIIRAAAEAAGRPMTELTARVRVRLDAPAAPRAYAMHGSPEAVAEEVRAFAALGVSHLALHFEDPDPARLVAAAERFHTEVEPLV